MIDGQAGRFLDEFAAALAEVDPSVIVALAARLDETRRKGGTTFVLGNGGSAAISSHLVCDLQLAVPLDPPFRAVSLAESPAILTAIGNDHGFEQTFRLQLAGRVRPGDVVVVISASARSPDLVRAVELARERGITAVGLLGSRGGSLLPLLDEALVVSTSSARVAESVFAMVAHAIAAQLAGPGAG